MAAQNGPMPETGGGSSARPPPIARKDLKSRLALDAQVTEAALFEAAKDDRGLRNLLEKDSLDYGDFRDPQRMFEDDASKLISAILKLKLDYEHGAVLRMWPKTRAKKSVRLSQMAREAGNELLRVSDDQFQVLSETLSYYNEALLFAPRDQQEFALALANRAVVLGKAGQHLAALQDLESAIASGTYPTGGLHKLYQRAAKACEAMEKFDAATGYYKKLADILQHQDFSTGMDKTLRARLRTEATRAQEFCRKRSVEASFTNFEAFHINEEDGKDRLLSSYRGLHPRLPDTSDAVEVLYSENRGRYIVAARDMDAAECVLHEKATVSSLNPRHYLSHCYYCQKNTVFPVPCDGCAGAVFCSGQCLTEARQSHGHDCQLSMYDLYLHQGNCGGGYAALVFLAYRAVVQKPKHFFEEWVFQRLPPLQPSDAGTDAFLPVGDPRMDGYDILLNLLPHLDSLGTVSRLMERAQTAVFLLNCLEATGYFEGRGRHPDDRVRFARLLLHTFSVALTNNHSVSEVSPPPPGGDPATSLQGFQRYTTGNCIFGRTASLVNHSCDPNTSTLYLEGNVQVTVTTRSIRRGEEINHIYQAHFGDTPLEERRRTLLSMFHFWCQCRACREDYPLAGGLPATYADSADMDGVRHIMACSSSVLGRNDDDESLRLFLRSLDEQDNKDMERLRNAHHHQSDERSFLGALLSHYVERARVAGKILKFPNLIFLKQRAAITDCLWLVYGRRSFNARSLTLGGLYC